MDHTAIPVGAHDEIGTPGTEPSRLSRVRKIPIDLGDAPAAWIDWIDRRIQQEKPMAGTCGKCKLAGLLPACSG